MAEQQSDNSNDTSSYSVSSGEECRLCPACNAGRIFFLICPDCDGQGCYQCDGGTYAKCHRCGKRFCREAIDSWEPRQE